MSTAFHKLLRTTKKPASGYAASWLLQLWTHHRPTVGMLYDYNLARCQLWHLLGHKQRADDIGGDAAACSVCCFQETCLVVCLRGMLRCTHKSQRSAHTAHAQMLCAQQTCVANHLDVTYVIAAQPLSTRRESMHVTIDSCAVPCVCAFVRLCVCVCLGTSSAAAEPARARVRVCARKVARRCPRPQRPCMPAACS